MHLILIVAVLFLSSSAAEAKRHHQHHHLHKQSQKPKPRRHVPVIKHAQHDVDELHDSPEPQPLIETARQFLGGNPTGWAHQWCGAFLRLIVRSVGLPDLPDGNAAIAWARYGRASEPKPGAILVYPHHVALITKVLDMKKVVAISGNDWDANHRPRVLERARSLAGAVAVREVIVAVLRRFELAPAFTFRA
jgi:hypothetical protein